MGRRTTGPGGRPERRPAQGAGPERRSAGGGPERRPATGDGPRGDAVRDGGRPQAVPENLIDPAEFWSGRPDRSARPVARWWVGCSRHRAARHLPRLVRHLRPGPGGQAAPVPDLGRDRRDRPGRHTAPSSSGPRTCAGLRSPRPAREADRPAARRPARPLRRARRQAWASESLGVPTASTSGISTAPTATPRSWSPFREGDVPQARMRHVEGKTQAEPITEDVARGRGPQAVPAVRSGSQRA